MGTVTAKNEVSKNIPKEQRDENIAIMDFLRLRERQGDMVVVLSNQRLSKSMVLRNWLLRHNLRSAILILPASDEEREESAQYKKQRLQKLAKKVSVFCAIGNGLNKDIVPFMENQTPLVIHLGWPNSQPMNVSSLQSQCQYQVVRTSQLTFNHEERCYNCVVTILLYNPKKPEDHFISTGGQPPPPPDDDPDTGGEACSSLQSLKVLALIALATPILLHE